MKIPVLKLNEKLMERYEAKYQRVENYFGLLAYYGLAQSAAAAKDEGLLEKCRSYLAQYPDHFPHPHYNFESYRAGGNGKAWLFFKGLMPEAKEEIETYAQLTFHAPVGERGILCLPADKDSQVKRIWIDVVTCTTPFMLYAGLALQEEKYVDFAAQQCFAMYEVFLDETCGLLHQAKGFMDNPRRMSADHWSRGNGWGLVGLAELVRYLPEASVHRKKAESYFVDMIDALLPYQTEKGLWRQEIIEPLSWEESSGTGLILYCMGIGLRCGLLKGNVYREAFEKGILGLAKYCIKGDFSTHRSCPGCRCPGAGKKKGSVEAYLTEVLPTSDEVHSYGCMMLAFTEAYKNGIWEVEIPEK